MSVPTPPASGVPSGLPQVPPMPPAGAPEPQPTKTNVVALIALIVGAVGFLFACIPGALIVGWVLLPIAFVLGIVSLFLKGRRKWMGVVGLVLSIVGTIVGVFVFLAVVATAVDDAFESVSGGETTVTQPTDDEQEDAETAPAGDETQGTRENPYPLGSQISNDDWTVVVNSHTADGAAAVAEGNSFNEAAPAGSHYEIVNYTVTYTGDDSGIAAEVGLSLVTSSGNVLESYDALVVLGDSMGMDELYNGASATGSEAFLVPDGETVTIRVTPGFFADNVFVQP